MMEDDKKAKLLHRMLCEAKDQGSPIKDVVSYVLESKNVTSPMSRSKGKLSELRSPLLKSVGA